MDIVEINLRLRPIKPRNMSGESATKNRNSEGPYQRPEFLRDEPAGVSTPIPQ